MKKQRKWIFADWKLPNQKDLELISEMEFTDVVLGIGMVKDGKFQQRYGKARVMDSAETIKA